jgi:hypothetical protein
VVSSDRRRGNLWTCYQQRGRFVTSTLAKRSKRRTVHALSFHSLRHTTTSILKNAGVNSGIVMDVVGHQSTAISTHYTTIDSDAKRRAIERMREAISDTVQVGRKPEAKPNSKSQSPEEPLEQRITIAPLPYLPIIRAVCHSMVLMPARLNTPTNQ